MRQQGHCDVCWASRCLASRTTCARSVLKRRRLAPKHQAAEHRVGCDARQHDAGTDEGDPQRPGSARRLSDDQPVDHEPRKELFGGEPRPGEPTVDLKVLHAKIGQLAAPGTAVRQRTHVARPVASRRLRGGAQAHEHADAAHGTSRRCTASRTRARSLQLLQHAPTALEP